MFESLSDRLGGVFDKLTGRGFLKEEDVTQALREVRVALLEADVALPVAKDFIKRVKEQAVGEKVLKSIKPGQQVIKIVNDALVEMLGEENESLNLAGSPPVSVLMVGLQGSGKTTHTAKLAKFITEKQRKKVLMASLDVQRPAAQEQLQILGQQISVDSLPIIKGQSPLEITKRALETGKLEGYDVVMLDTAGRLSIDDELMTQVEEIRDLAKPIETLLVADAMTGQDAVQTATNFNNRIGITGIVLTRIDGDARGGAALSMKAVTGKPIKFLGVGEQTDALEAFHPSRVADRILGMGDIVSLVEKAADTIDQDEALKLADRMQKGLFDLNDFASQLKQMRKMGGLSGLMGFMPGMGKLKKMMGDTDVDDGLLIKQESIMSSMTIKERENPKLLNASRRKRIATGSGTSVQDVNRLLKQFQQMQGMMKKLKKMGGKGLMKSLGGMLGGGGMPDMGDIEAMAQKMGAGQKDATGNALGANPFEDPSGLGANPFASSNPAAAGLPDGAMPPMGMPMSGTGSATKSSMNKRKKAQAKKRSNYNDEN